MKKSTETKKTPTPAKGSPSDDAADQETIKHRAPLPVKSLPDDESAEVDVPDSNSTAKTYKIGDDADLGEEELRPSESAKAYRIDDSPLADEPVASATKQPSVHRIDDADEKDKPTTTKDRPAAESVAKRPAVHRVSDLPQSSVQESVPAESAETTPATEGKSIAALIQFNPSKSPKAPPANRVRPTLIKLVQPEDTVPPSVVAEKVDTEVPSPATEQEPHLARGNADPSRLPTYAQTEQEPRPADINSDQSPLPVSAQEPLPPGGNAQPRGAAPSELPEEIQAEFKSITSLGTKIRAEGEKFPADSALARFQREGELYHALGYRREWAASSYAWTAPGLCHYPLYFEDVNLERHGYSLGLLQPAASALNFYGRIAFLPYMMAVNRPLECQYTLGHYRPGSYAPWHLHRPPVRARGFVAEAATVAALFLIFP